MKKIMKILISIVLIVLVGCKKNDIVYKSFYLEEAFSIVPIVTVMVDNPSLISDELANELSNITNELDKKFNVFNDDSLISEINKNAGIKEVEVDEEFLLVLECAISVSQDTKINNKVLYDVSIFSIWNEWRFNENYYQLNNYSKIPSKDVIKQKLPLVDYNKVIIDKYNNTVYLQDKGMMIDLGSIVKGYAAEKISLHLESKGLYNNLIDVGGNVITMGKNIGTNKNWKAGILEPYSIDNQIGYIKTNSNKETLVTSGVYQRYIIHQNEETKELEMYHHILNPLTGYPEDNELLSVTIITNNSMIADAYSTAIFLLGLNKGLEYVNNVDFLEAIFITKNKEIILSKGIESRFVINENIYNEGYKIINL